MDPNLDNNNSSNRFFDSNTLMAIVLSFAFFVFWQSYMNKKYPADTKKTDLAREQNTQPGAQGTTSPNNSTAKNMEKTETPSQNLSATGQNPQTPSPAVPQGAPKEDLTTLKYPNTLSMLSLIHI